MSNFCKCSLKISGPKNDIKNFREVVKSGEEQLSFNKLLPIPQKLIDTESGDIGEMGYQIFYNPSSDWKLNIQSGFVGKIEHFHPGIIEEIIRTNDRERLQLEIEEHEPDAREMRELGLKYHQNIMESGYPTWYEWCMSNWGVKWGASEVECKETGSALYYKFLCPWNAPVKFVENASKMFPTLKFIIRGTDSGMDYHMSMTFIDGEGSPSGDKLANIPLGIEMERKIGELTHDLCQKKVNLSVI